MPNAAVKVINAFTIRYASGRVYLETAVLAGYEKRGRSFGGLGTYVGEWKYYLIGGLLSHAAAVLRPTPEGWEAHCLRTGTNLEAPAIKLELVVLVYREGGREVEKWANYVRVTKWLACEGLVRDSATAWSLEQALRRIAEYNADFPGYRLITRNCRHWIGKTQGEGGLFGTMRARPAEAVQAPPDDETVEEGKTRLGRVATELQLRLYFVEGKIWGGSSFSGQSKSRAYAPPPGAGRHRNDQFVVDNELVRPEPE